jgi:hypothetical protein
VVALGLSVTDCRANDKTNSGLFWLPAKAADNAFLFGLAAVRLIPGAPVRMKVRTLMLLKFHYDPTAEGLPTAASTSKIFR